MCDFPLVSAEQRQQNRQGRAGIAPWKAAYARERSRTGSGATAERSMGTPTTLLSRNIIPA